MRGAWVVAAVVTGVIVACSGAPDRAPAPTFRDDVAPIFAARCEGCHGSTRAEGGYRTTTYLEAIACGDSGLPANGAEGAQILRALDRPSHAGVVSGDERSVIERWLAAGSPDFRGGVHDPSFADPRSPGSHARFLRARAWKPMLDPSDADACSRCHDAKIPAPGATSCASCHTEPNGPLACSTCHGSKGKAHPPRDACFHPEDPPDTSHAAHQRFDCSTCHPKPAGMGGTHGDGHVEVWFDQGLAGVGARFDGACTTRCHAGPGALRPKPKWNEAKMKCGDCHSTPPAAHYEGACAQCHRDPGGASHVNGRVDLGDGSGKCGACHGTGDDPWPTTGAHAKHKTPVDAAPVACDTCHELPSGKHPSGGGAKVRLIGLAAKGGLAPTYDAKTGTCASTYCHSLGGATKPTPSWTKDAITCGGCHSTPPPPPHSTSASCGSTNCHESKISSATHVDGTIQLH